VIAPNIERNSRFANAPEEGGGLDEMVEAIVEKSREAGLPVIFALTRKRLARALSMWHTFAAPHGGQGGRPSRSGGGISVCGLLSVEGQNREFDRCKKLAEEAETKWVLARLAGASAVAV